MIRRLVWLFTNPSLDAEWTIVGGGAAVVLAVAAIAIVAINRVAGVH